MKARYYESELAYLREQGRALAERHPRTAGLLAERSDDPDVERLLEGFAFLAAAVRERIDDAVPELAQAYAAALVPQLTRFIPPTSLIEYRPQSQGLRVPELVPRGTTVSGTGSSEVACLFQTTSPTVLLPLTLERVEHRRPLERIDELILSFRGSEHQASEIGTHRVRLFFQGDQQLWTGLRTWFLRHCQLIEVLIDGQVVGKLPAEDIVGVGHRDEDRLLPPQPLEHDAFTRVAEFFSSPAKFAFVELPALGAHVDAEFKLRCVFRGAPKLPKTPSTSDIRLHCIPVVNLFECELEPARVDPLSPWTLLRPAGYAPAHSEVWDLKRVEGIGPSVRHTYIGFDQAGAGKSSIEYFYVTRREGAAQGLGTERRLALVSALDKAPPVDVEVLSMTALCSNRSLACELGIGQLSKPVRGAGASVPFANIKPVAPPLYPNDDAELLWRLGAHLSLSRKELFDADTLRTLLRAYNFAAGSNPSLAGINARWIESIRDVRVQSCVRLIRGAPLTGTRTVVVVDAAQFASVGEAQVLGEMLDDVFARRAGINSFNVFGLEVAPSGATFAWPPRNASTTL